MKCLFILIGESFREGRCESRVIDTNYGYKQQLESTKSHNKLISKLDKVDVAINTRDTKYKEELLSWYPNVIYSHFTNEDYGYYNNVVHRSLQNILSNVNLNDYDFIFITRFDILLKDKLIEIFNPNWSCITFPYAVYMEYKPLQFPFVTDTMCFIPKKYFFNPNWSLQNNTYKLLHHHCWRDLLQNGLNIDDLDVMIETLHNPNTDAGWNPLYIINSRPENKNQGLNNQIYDKKINNIKFI